MINEGSAKKFCCEDVSKIENYAEAIADTATWHIHHRRELNPDGKFAYSSEELIKMGMYYGRPASELIFLTESEHRSLHRKGCSEAALVKMSTSRKGMSNTAEHRSKIAAALKGHKVSDETRQKISEAHRGKKLGSNNHFFGKTHTAESRLKMSEAKKDKIPWNKGKTVSAETKQKVSDSLKKYWQNRRKKKEM